MKSLEKILMWRAPFLPKLRLSQWWAIWGANFATMLVYWLGRWLDWWPSNDTIANVTTFLFALLAFTPLDFSGPRVFYLVRRVDGGEFLPVSFWEAWKLRSNPALEVHRVMMKDGKVVHGKRLT